MLRGQGKIESRGLITADGLQPHPVYASSAAGPIAWRPRFDWESGIVTLHDNKTAPLELPTFDPLALMWQFYFTPPTSDR